MIPRGTPAVLFGVRDFDPLRRGIGVRPLELDRITRRFDPLPGVVILELRRAQVAERGV